LSRSAAIVGKKERLVSVNPWRRITTSPSPFPASTYFRVMPVESSVVFFVLSNDGSVLSFGGFPDDPSPAQPVRKAKQTSAEIRDARISFASIR